MCLIITKLQNKLRQHQSKIEKEIHKKRPILFKRELVTRVCEIKTHIMCHLAAILYISSPKKNNKHVCEEEENQRF